MCVTVLLIASLFSRTFLDMFIRVCTGYCWIRAYPQKQGGGSNLGKQEIRRQMCEPLHLWACPWRPQLWESRKLNRSIQPRLLGPGWWRKVIHPQRMWLSVSHLSDQRGHSWNGARWTPINPTTTLSTLDLDLPCPSTSGLSHATMACDIHSWFSLFFTVKFRRRSWHFLQLDYPFQTITPVLCIKQTNKTTTTTESNRTTIKRRT